MHVALLRGLDKERNQKKELQKREGRKDPKANTSWFDNAKFKLYAAVDG